jgi:hypothetical protein
VANTLNLFRQGAVGFIDWLDGLLLFHTRAFKLMLFIVSRYEALGPNIENGPSQILANVGIWRSILQHVNYNLVALNSPHARIAVRIFAIESVGEGVICAKCHRGADVDAATGPNADQLPLE